MISSRLRMISSAFIAVVTISCTPALVDGWQYDEHYPPPQKPKIAPASDEGMQAISTFKVPPFIKVELFAAEPDVANPVAIDVDRFGRVYVCESFRQENGVEDNREHPEWLNDDLQARTVADRLAYMKKHLKAKILSYSAQDDRIRLLEDTDGDGKADKSEVFASGFNSPLSGTGAGVLSLGEDVWYTCIPHLYRLNRDKDGKVNRTEVHSGFGVRFAFRGHDLHGLTVGPDGRIYFSIGDRGYAVNQEVFNPETGAVFRCEMDGSNLEVFAVGLRNPQELAFDNFGNLFTGDNNSDSGDKARFVHVVEGGDSGWRMQYQYLDDRGPFNREEIWKPFSENTPAYIVPCVDNVASGPSGITFYPGTGWTNEFNNYFFLCDFLGQSKSSGIRAISLETKGATFSIARNRMFAENILATDADFGPDGKLYVSDWVHGWQGLGKGRIYTFEHQSPADPSANGEVKEILENGLADKSKIELGRLLGHADRRVRMEAQFEMVKKKHFDELLRVAGQDRAIFSQLHAIWGLGQLLRLGFEPTSEQNEAIDEWIQLSVKSAKADVRAQILKFVGEQKRSKFSNLVQSSLDDAENRVRYHAAMALSKIGTEENVPAICDMLAANRDRDPMLRHAGIMALAGIAHEYHVNKDPKEKIQSFLANHPLKHAFSKQPVGVRLAVIVALRRLPFKHDPGLVASGLRDRDPRVQLEAARAVYDFPTLKAYRLLADQLGSSQDLPEPLVRRQLHANFILGGSENSSKIVKFVGNSENEISLRIEALTLVSQWAQPPAIDAINGRYREIKGRRDVVATKLVMPKLWRDIQDDSDPLKIAFIEAAISLKVKLLADPFAKIVEDESSSSELKRICLRALEVFEYSGLEKLLEKVLDSSSEITRAEALKIYSQKNPDAAIERLSTAVKSASLHERKIALESLGTMNNEASAKLIEDIVSDFFQLPPEFQLEAYQAAQNRKAEIDSSALEKVQEKLKESPLGLFQLTLFGGDLENGKTIHNRTELSCVRCHKIENTGGEIGPELTTIAKEKSREYLLQSIVDPNKDIAKEFQSWLVVDIDGNMSVGIIKHNDDDRIDLMDDQGEIKSIRQEDIEDIRQTKSSMPEDLVEKLTLEELRDLIEYLASLE